MEDSDSFDALYRKIVNAKSYKEIFRDFESEDKNENIKELRFRYLKFISKIHPDRHSKNLKEKHMAEEATIALMDYYEEAQRAIDKGIYGKKSPRKYPHKNTEMKFRAGDYNYTIFSESVEGDFCRVYYGEREGKKGDFENICLKVPQNQDDNDLLINESKILQSIQHKSVPVYLDSFKINDGRRANVLRRIEKSYDLYGVREKFPNGLPEEHTVWVMDRLLSVLGYLHINNVIHGSIEPGNIMITPENHNGLLIDYVLSVPEANRDGKKYKGLNDYSAPEIKLGSPPHPASDMYSLGKSIVYLLGGRGKNIPDSIDSRIKKYVGGFLYEDPRIRKNDAWEAWHKLKDLREEVFGARSQFLELKIKR